MPIFAVKATNSVFVPGHAAGGGGGQLTGTTMHDQTIAKQLVTAVGDDVQSEVQ